MTAWLFDLGNTRLKCAPLIDGHPGEVLALPHHREDIAAALQEALPERFQVAYLASVAAPEVSVEVMEQLARRCRRISRARTQAAFGGVRIAYAQPHKLGVDRFLTLLAAHARGAGAHATLTCGIGTALTIDLIDRDGLHRGGRIAPSPTLMREALHDRAAQLPVEGGEYVGFAGDTEDALASGCDGAALALIEHSLRAAHELLGEMPRLYLHGGGTEGLVAQLPTAQSVPTLVLEGLARWARADR